MALGAALPAAALSLLLLWFGDHATKVQWTLTVVIVTSWLGLAFAAREEVIRPLHTISNLLAALREGDFSIRGRRSFGDDALGTAMLEVNALGEVLREQRLGALEASALLRKIMAEIDVAVFAFDEAGRLRVINRAGEKLLGQPEGRVEGRSAEALGLEELLHGDAPRTVDLAFPGGTGPWELRRGIFRQGGLPHQLLVLADLQRALREEERLAWQRLVRVLGHEINNSLAPIQSIAGGLQDTLRREPRQLGWEDDLQRGLAVIARRAEALGRFMSSYARLARLPPPKLAPVDVGAWIRRGVDLEKRLPVTLEPGPEISIPGDADQLEQLLINLLRNAVDAALETGGGVTVSWRRLPTALEVSVLDEGPGIADTNNLFVPFFTTKPNGSGIGLVLSRQIAEAHRGSLTLENRGEPGGCVARLRLPLRRISGGPAGVPAADRGSGASA
jgi:nitrogen fixation/metabolism regulation signal transduction histidine kinase